MSKLSLSVQKAGVLPARLSSAERALAAVENPGQAKRLYDELETLGQYARRVRADTEQQNEIARLKLQVAHKGGGLLRKTVKRGNPQWSHDGTFGLPDGFTKNMSSRWQRLSRKFPTVEDLLDAIDTRRVTAEDAITLQEFVASTAHLSAEKDEWATPQALFDRLDAEFHFELDVCASADNAKCKRYFTKDDNALEQQWLGACWMNPPYSGITDWMAKAKAEAETGATVVCLVPSRTEVAWFWDHARDGEIRFLRGRLSFIDDEGNTGPAPFPSCVVVFGRPPGFVWYD